MDSIDESQPLPHDRYTGMMSFDASSSSADDPSLTSALSLPNSTIAAIADSLPLTKWCPSMVDRIRKEYNLATANFIFSLPRRAPPLRDHSTCTKVRCIANDTQDLGYKSTHWQDCTECVFSGPDPQDIIDIIDHGGIPLISIKSNGLGGLGIQVAKATPKLNYFAVSHVWSGGLGNPGANALPNCQIRRLYDIWAAFRDHQRNMRDQLPLVRPDRVSEAYWREAYLKEESQIPECLVWIDTLCIPVDPRYKHLRIQAINSMAQIYASAQSIVILDHELQQFRYQEMSNSTIFAYMLCSAWMSRCWTFQEGALAKDWLVQFADGLCCIDDRCKAEPTDATSNHGSQEDRPELLSWYKEMPRPYGQCTFSRDPFSSQSLLLRQIWNNLCTRTTTKREDIVSILAIMLELRPSEILDLPSNRRVLSIFNAMTAVPFSFLYRERPSITNWRGARCWLPSTIEEVPIDPGGGIMWRRSLRDNFFIFELSKSGYLSASRQDQVPRSQLPRFYFLSTLIGLKRCLTLVDRAKNQRIEITLGIAEHFYIPHLEICILIGNNESSDNYFDSRPNNTNGVCLGIRDRRQHFVRLFYICPIQCSVSTLDNPQSGELYQSEANPEIIVQEVEVSEGVEHVIEHDFADAVQLHESRLVGVLFVTLSKRLLALPFCICCIYWILTLVATFTYFTDGYNGKLEKAPSTLKYILVVFVIGILQVFKTWAYVSEATAAYETLQQIEFDGWYGGLYNKEIESGSTMVNIHYSPRTTFGLLAAGALCLPLLLAPQVNLDADIVCLLLLIFTEAGQLVLRWLLELCAHLPARINIQWRIATYHTAQSERIARYYEHFYSFSRLTRFIRDVGFAKLRLFRSKSDLSRLSTVGQHQDPLLSPPLAISTQFQLPTASGHDYEPWSNKGIQIFIPSTHQHILRYKLSRGDRELTENPDWYPPFLYLGELISLPYYALGFYWIFCFIFVGAPFGGLHRRAINPDLTLCEFRTPHILGFSQCTLRLLGVLFAASTISVFCVTMIVATLAEAILFAQRPLQPAKITGWNRLLYTDWNLSHNSQMNASIHYSPRTTWLLLSVFCPLAALIFVPHRLSWNVLAFSISAILFLLSLMLRWRFELTAARMGDDDPWKKTADGDVGSGNEALDECFARLYAKSTLTI